MNLIIHGAGGYLPFCPSLVDPSSMARYRVPRGASPGSALFVAFADYTHPRLASDVLNSYPPHFIYLGRMKG